MANTYLTRTNSSPTNAKKYTWSSWNKIDSGGWYPFFSTTHQGGHSYIGFGASGSSFGVIEHGDSAGTLYYLSTSSIQRDTSGWYHVVVQFDSTQSTASDRIKIYINNVLQTSFGNSDYPSQNLDSWFVDATTIEIGRRSQGSGQYYSGLISHAHFIDGTVYAPSTFGETDSTTGEWKIKTDPAISTANYGNNGFWMFKDNNSLNDNSGNGNNFSLGGGTLTKTEDNPSNVFATCNPLSKGSDWVFSKGNTNIRNDVNTQNNALGTIALHNGKYYWEVYRHGGGDVGFGITKAFVDGTNHTQVNDNRVLYYQDGNIYREGLGSNSPVNTGVTYGDTDTLAVAVDSINGVITFYKNGTQTGSITDTQLISSNELWIPWFLGRSGSEMRINFGNGYFGTTAVSSAGTNASGIGIFEYDVPTGYTALSTKGLNL
jgi:hypothetical protein